MSRPGRRTDTSDLGGLSLPLDDCPSGCDLDYVARFEAGPTVLPGSIARYRVDLVIEYPTSFGTHPASLATIELEHPASGPAPTWWSVLAGVLGLAAGWVLAPRVDGALGRRRRWPAIALAVVPVGTLVVLGLQRVAVVLPYGLATANALFYALEPWSLALLGTLTWGVVRGIRRWDADGGWALGLGAVATGWARRPVAGLVDDPGTGQPADRVRRRRGAPRRPRRMPSSGRAGGSTRGRSTTGAWRGRPSCPTAWSSPASGSWR